VIGVVERGKKGRPLTKRAWRRGVGGGARSPEEERGGRIAPDYHQVLEANGSRQGETDSWGVYENFQGGGGQGAREEGRSPNKEINRPGGQRGGQEGKSRYKTLPQKGETLRRIRSVSTMDDPRPQTVESFEEEEVGGGRIQGT